MYILCHINLYIIRTKKRIKKNRLISKSPFETLCLPPPRHRGKKIRVYAGHIAVRRRIVRKNAIWDV